MIITPSRVKLIRNHFFEFSFDDNESEEEIIPDFEIFKTLSSAEQYYLASIYNWDDGTIVLDWIIDSRKCDKGTACMIFWRAEPDYYYNYTAETIEGYQSDVWYLLQKVIKRFKNDDFITSKFEFIPTNEGYKTDWPIKLDIWNFPTELNDGIEGKKPFRFGF